MKHLQILNVGPIKRVDLLMKRFNFFIGPQSSGKSTIAKIFSTCNWVEKEVATTHNENFFTKPDDFISQMVDFHKMDTYFNQFSEIHYETDVVKIDLVGSDSLSIKLKDWDAYQRMKICYIPAERNVATLPELQGFEFRATNLRSFLFDWFYARENYDVDHKSEVLNLGVKYFYDPNDSRYKDRLEHDNDASCCMPLGSASSGLLSVIPLHVMMKYYTNQYFKDFKDRMSFVDDSKRRSIQNRLTDEIVLKTYFKDYDSSNRIQFIKKANNLIHERNEQIMPLFNKYRRLLYRLTIPYATNFIIEEPEQNLFPSTQTELVDYIVGLCASEARQHELTITTHSPYILNQLNLMFKRHDCGLKGKVGLDYDDVLVCAVDHGTAVDLKVSNAHLVNPEYLSLPLDNIYNEYESYE